MKLKIEYVPKEQLKPYVGNAKLHPAEQVEQIKKSIQEFGFRDPIAIWHDNEIIEGHGRLLAVMEMPEITEVPVIRLDDLTDEQRRAYALVHNKLTMNTDFDFGLLELELESIPDIKISDFGFESLFEDMSDLFSENEEDQIGNDGFYTNAINLPQYEPKGECPDISALIDIEKYNELYKKIQTANIDYEIKQFLFYAAARHIGFNYKEIANFYAHQPKQIQKLMEDSALILIDVNDAIRNGYAELNNRLDEIEEIDNAE